MAPKKKPAAAGADQEAWDNFKRCLKKNEQEFDTPKIPAFQEIQRQIEGDGINLQSWVFDSEFDAMAFRILFHSLAQAPYLDITAIRVWKCEGGDESVRSVCAYLDNDPPPQVCDVSFMDNDVSPLGCEFLARTLGPNGNKLINRLLLDYNQFGTPGVEKLSLGLSQNSTLRYLSLQYCNIGEDGGIFLAHVLMFHKNALEVLKLRGNYLGNPGVMDVLSGARRTKALAEIDLYDNKFCDTPDLIKVLEDLFTNNVVLTTYDLSGNKISDRGAHDLVQKMIGKNHLSKVFVTEQVASKTWEALDEVTSGGKGKKKGKKRK